MVEGGDGDAVVHVEDVVADGWENPGGSAVLGGELAEAACGFEGVVGIFDAAGFDGDALQRGGAGGDEVGDGLGGEGVAPGALERLGPGDRGLVETVGGGFGAEVAGPVGDFGSGEVAGDERGKGGVHTVPDTGSETCALTAVAV